MTACFTGCFNSRFDLSDIVTEGASLGEAFIAPLGTITLSSSELIPGIGPVTIPANIGLPLLDKTVRLNVGMDPGVIERLTRKGTVSVRTTITNPFPIEATLSLSFITNATEIFVFENELVASLAVTIVTKELTREELLGIADANYVRIQLGNAVVTRAFLYDPSLDQTLTVHLVLLQQGGLSFD